MARKVSLTCQQAAKICLQAFDGARDLIEDAMVIPSHRLEDIGNTSGEFIRVSEVYLGDMFGAIDIIFRLDGKVYIYTVEQAADGTYCSAFDPEYNHVATELKPKRRRRR